MESKITPKIVRHLVWDLIVLDTSESVQKAWHLWHQHGKRMYFKTLFSICSFSFKFAKMIFCCKVILSTCHVVHKHKFHWEERRRISKSVLFCGWRKVSSTIWPKTRSKFYQFACQVYCITPPIASSTTPTSRRRRGSTSRRRRPSDSRSRTFTSGAK